MEKVLIEVGSTNTKIDLCNNTIQHIETVVIEFKKNYQKENRLEKKDIKKLIYHVKKQQEKYANIYVCGTSIFRVLPEKQKKEFLTEFLTKTGIAFHIIDQEKENELTVLGATKNVNQKVAVFVGGGGSTEIAIYDKEILEMINTKMGVGDIMNQYPDLAEDIATTDIETIKKIVMQNLNLPKQKADILILAGGGHLNFALNSGIRYQRNTLYQDELQPVMMDLKTRKEDSNRYYKEISLEEIRSRVKDPDWWYATRAMCAFVLVVAEEIGAKYIVPTDISMVHGIG